MTEKWRCVGTLARVAVTYFLFRVVVLVPTYVLILAGRILRVACRVVAAEGCWS